MRFLVPISLLAAPIVFLIPTQTGAANTAGGLSVFVGYAEDKEFQTPNPASFPTPWVGAPNTTFLGGTVPGQTACGTLTACYDAGAIRLDNPGRFPISVSNVSVDDHSSVAGGKLFSNLWGSFSVPPGQSVILTENPPANNPTYDNFDTSSYPATCTPVTVAPTVTLTVNGVPTTLVDSTHVLDTGGIDAGSCAPKHNESIQWRPIGATGNTNATLTLGPATATAFSGRPTTETATLLDGSGTGLPNTSVNFSVLSGPDAGMTGTAVTNTSGQANFTYTGTKNGEDVVTASVSTVGQFVSNRSDVIWANGSSTGWSSADIGNPTPAGGQAFNATPGAWTLMGGGTAIGGTSDQFHYVWQTISGAAADVAARVTSQTNTNPGAQAGVMLRASTNPASAFYGAFLTPGGGIEVQQRPSQGASVTTVVQTPGAAPAYLWVAASSGFEVTFGSNDGYTWSPITGSGAGANLGSNPLAGLAVTSGTSTQLSSATMDSVVLGTSPPAPLPPVPCPSTWTCADIGNPTPAGSQSFDPGTGTWTIQGGGSDITGTSDQFHFDSQSLTGDGTVSADVVSQTNSDSNAKAGIMLRTSTDPGSPNYAVVVSPGAGIKVQVRSTQGGTTTKIANPTGTTPVHLEVTRSGNTFSSYTSPDGSTWTLIPGSTATVSLGSTVLAGLAVTSHNSGVLSTVVMNSVSTGGSSTPPAPPSVTLAPTSQSANTGASQKVTAAVIDGSGNPLQGTTVTFNVVSGPDAGQSASAVTDAAGHAVYTDTSATAGTDTIQASFVDSTATTRTSNQAQVTFVTPTTGGVVISNLTVNDTARVAQWSVQPNLQVGSVLYGDRTYTLTAAPSQVLGDAWIRDANGSKAYTGSPLVTFTINQQATVYVGMDTRAGRPSWLDATWTDTGLTETGTGPVTYELFAHTFPAGTVVLGPIGGTATAVSMYTIAVG